MKITFLGGADEVGASCILLEMAGRRLLVDAGLRPSPKARWGLAGDQLPDLSLIDPAGASPRGLDAVLVTHAHTDHTGALELVLGRYPECPVYATPVTIALARILHADSRRIMQTRLDEEGELPLFDEVATQKLLAACVPVPFNTRLPLGEGLAATFYPAGHIAGAACLALECDEGRVLISGDVSVSPQRTVDGLRPPPFRPDILILESTYGGRLHANRAVEERRLAAAVGEVTAAGGKVLIPAFALGRAQEVLLTLAEFRRQGALPDVPVWADGMVRAVCQAYAGFAEALPLALRERGAQFFDARTRPVENARQRSALLFDPAPAVIISSSGMLAGGPSVQYARALAGRPEHAILLTGYQDEESPGRRLQAMAAEGRGTLRLGRDRVDVQCRLATYSLSAHADEAQLVSLAETLDPAEVFLVHGDEGARASLAQALRERGRAVHLPHAGQSFSRTYAPGVGARRGALGAGQPLDLRALWEGAAAPGGGYYTLRELAVAWWGAAGAERAAEVEAALKREGRYFALDPARPGVARAQTAAQVALSGQRRERLRALPPLAGRWLIVRDAAGEARLARCAAVGVETVRLEGDEAGLGPEAVLEVLDGPIDPAAVEALAAQLDPAALLPDSTPRPLEQLPGQSGEARAAAALALLRGGAARAPAGYARAASAAAPAGRMEPNQALAYARAQFPPEARLRKCGYRLDQGLITLTFDFPDAAEGRYAEIIVALRAATGWEVAVEAGANQTALAALVREVLPPDWTVEKGPAIQRETRQVSVTVSSGAETRVALNAAAERFEAVSGWRLNAVVAATGGRAAPPVAAALEGPAWEINAAYAEIKRALAGSTLYRTSLKGQEVVLGFISPQVGERYRDR
ncbi:MAG: MBL fold metallo-hydrolase, partial [Anaerolineales bacterium]|nr:MBL fold metallo-hydrolase [Anaerolineales bacterium]